MDGSLAQTREVLHRVAAHILARRCFEVSGRIALRPSPGGIATPAFGEPPECLRIAGGVLIREVGDKAAYASINGATLRRLARFAGASLEAPFTQGGDAIPDLGDPDEVVELGTKHVATLADWYALGCQILDEVMATLPASAAPATLQLWPEHFDIGTDVGVANGGRVNLGCSPGDAYVDEPYLYLGPWGDGRPGDPAYWNAPFGAVLRASEVAGSSDSIADGVRFLHTGLDRLSPPTT